MIIQVMTDNKSIEGGSENKAAQVSALIMAGATVIGYVIGEGLADSTYKGKHEKEE